MSKLEDVIKALQLCQYDPDPEDEDQPCKVMVSCEICPYWNDYGGCRFNDLLSDALAILKARKPVEPRVDVDTWVCANCGHKLEQQELLGDNVLCHERYDYCPHCGRPVAWYG